MKGGQARWDAFRVNTTNPPTVPPERFPVRIGPDSVGFVAMLSRPDGAKIHWERRGEGPALYIAHNPMVSMPGNFDALLADLARDHRVVTWDPRGVGQSSGGGPYDLSTDAEDLAAVIEEAGPGGVTVSLGNSPAPLDLVGTQPELFAAVLLVGALPQLAPSDGDEPESLTDSGSVTAATLQMARTDPRALLRTWMTLGNPQLNEAELQERMEDQLAYCPVSAGVPRVESYISYNASRSCAELGDRLWMIHWENPISADRALTRLRARLPEAHIVETEDGPISRPDQTAAVVREVTASL
jgi:pimeloyl-ACP methyl ester carboxylesterase